MRLELRGHHVDITPALRRLVGAKLAKIEQLLNDRAVSVKAILTIEKHRHRANITLHARGEKFLHGEAETDKWETAVAKAWNDLETARQTFLLLESSIASAQENVRLQDLSFREGQATSLDVIDARLGLARAQIERSQSAYQFDLALAQLLELSGQTERFPEYLRRADRVIDP